MYCPMCGSKNDDNQVACAHCFFDLRETKDNSSEFKSSNDYDFLMDAINLSKQFRAKANVADMLDEVSSLINILFFICNVDTTIYKLSLESAANSFDRIWNSSLDDRRIQNGANEKKWAHYVLRDMHYANKDDKKIDAVPRLDSKDLSLCTQTGVSKRDIKFAYFGCKNFDISFKNSLIILLEAGGHKIMRRHASSLNDFAIRLHKNVLTLIEYKKQISNFLYSQLSILAGLSFSDHDKAFKLITEIWHEGLKANEDNSMKWLSRTCNDLYNISGHASDKLFFLIKHNIFFESS